MVSPSVEPMELVPSPTNAWRRRRLAACALALVGASACHQLVNSGRSASYAIVDKVEAAPGAQPTEFGGLLHSDVFTAGCVWSDPARVTMRLALKDVGPAGSPNQPSNNNLITFDRYRVVFSRSDGRNTPGVDVPHAFDGAATFTVPDTGITAAFQLVRLQAKLEPPLIALRGGGGAIALTTIAEVTFFGHDQTGTPVTATGAISVHFADWGDPDGVKCN